MTTRDRTDHRQVPVSGRQPGAGTTFIGGVVGATASDATEVMRLVRDDDMDRPADAAVLAAVRTVLTESPEVFGPNTVMDVIIRRGSNSDIRRALVDAVSAGAASSHGALMYYAAVVVSGSYRRRLESLGNALILAATDAPEGALTAQMDAAVAALHAIDQRLHVLRGDQP